jgi:hypothetical protein
MIRLLVAYGANPNTGGAGSSSLCESEGPPLYLASWQDAAPAGGETVAALIECGADPCYRPEPWVPSPLEMAAMHVAPQQVRVLLGAGAPANARSPKGWTPLLLACLGGVHVEDTDPGRLAEVVSMLLEAGADPAVASHEGLTALHYAANWDIRGAVPLLVAHGADPDGVSREGKTALQYAAERGSPSPAQELLSCGADPLIRDQDGHTPAELADAKGHGQLAALLRAAETSAQAGGARKPDRAATRLVPD